MNLALAEFITLNRLALMRSIASHCFEASLCKGGVGGIYYGI